MEDSATAREEDNATVREEGTPNILAACMKRALAHHKRDSNTPFLLGTVYTSELMMQAAPPGIDTAGQLAAAAEEAAKGAAENLITKEVDELIKETLSAPKVSSQLADQLIAELGRVTKMCREGSEGKAEVADAARQLTKSEAKVDVTAEDLAMRAVTEVEHGCSVEAMDVDYFAKHGFVLDHDADCFPSVKTALLQQTRQLGHRINTHFKSILALHTDQNQLAHHVAAHVRQHGAGVLAGRAFMLSQKSESEPLHQKTLVTEAGRAASPH